MRLLFNVTDAVGADTNHGITRTERQLALALRHDPDVDFVAMHQGRLWLVDCDDLDRSLAPAGGTTFTPAVEVFGRTPAPTGRTRQRGAPRGPVRLAPLTVTDDTSLVSVGLDWVHGLLTEAQRLVAAHDVRYVGFVYDMIPVDHPEWVYPPDPFAFLRHIEHMTAIADRVACISHSTRNDLLRRVPSLDGDRVHVVTLGADSTPEPGDAETEFAATLFDGEPFAVYCATLDRRKNHELLYRVARRLAHDGQPGNIVFVGKVGTGVDDLVDCLRHDREIAGRVAHVTNCDDRHLAALYRRARFAVYPSLYEGWGLGVTEALAHGIPCLIASGSSLGEAGLGQCPELHPLDTKAWAGAMARWFADAPPPPRVDLPTWDDTAAQIRALAAR